LRASAEQQRIDTKNKDVRSGFAALALRSKKSTPGHSEEAPDRTFDPERARSSPAELHLDDGLGGIDLLNDPFGHLAVRAAHALGLERQLEVLLDHREEAGRSLGLTVCVADRLLAKFGLTEDFAHFVHVVSAEP